MQVDWSDVPGALSVLFSLVSRDVAELDQQLGECHLLLGRLLRVENRRRRPSRVLYKGLLLIDCRANFQPVGLSMLLLAQAAFDKVSCAHTVVNIVHMSRQFVHRSSIFFRDQLIV